MSLSLGALGLGAFPDAKPSGAAYPLVGGTMMPVPAPASKPAGTHGQPAAGMSR